MRVFPYLTVISFLCFLVILPAGFAQSGPASERAARADAPGIPSFTGFVRFQDRRQLFLDVQRVGFDHLRIRSPGSKSWTSVQFDQFPPGERERLMRKLLVPEETHPPRLKGLRVTIKGGETLEGFLKEIDSEEWAEVWKNHQQQVDQEGDSNGSGSAESDPSGADQKFVLYTKNDGQRRLSFHFVTDYEFITVNPLKMLGAVQLYNVEKNKRTLDAAADHWELGKICLQSRLFKRAKMHFRTAAEINSAYAPAVDLRLELIQEWQPSQEEGDDASSDSGDPEASSGDSSGGQN